MDHLTQQLTQLTGQLVCVTFLPVYMMIIAGVQPSVAPQAAPAPAAAPTPPPIEWAIPQQKRVQYMAQFQANDKAKTGFLAAVQARSILLQTGLAQQTLAAVWNLSDIDKVSPVLTAGPLLYLIFHFRTGS